MIDHPLLLAVFWTLVSIATQYAVAVAEQKLRAWGVLPPLAPPPTVIRRVPVKVQAMPGAIWGDGPLPPSAPQIELLAAVPAVGTVVPFGPRRGMVVAVELLGPGSPETSPPFWDCVAVASVTPLPEGPEPPASTGAAS